MVAMDVWPTETGPGIVATEARWRKMARLFNGSGIVMGTGTEMAPSLSFPSLTIGAGAVWIDGHYAEMLTPQVLTATATGIAVVRWDPADQSCNLVWRDGVITPTQTVEGVYELVLFRYNLGTGTDMRSFIDAHADAQSIVLDNVINATVNVGATNQSMLVGSFVMPFDGVATFNGSLKIANVTGGLCAVDPIEVSTSSTPPPDSHPPATWRSEAAPGAGQMITHIPIIGQWLNLTRGQTVTIRAACTVGGAVGLQVGRASGVVTLTKDATGPT